MTASRAIRALLTALAAFLLAMGAAPAMAQESSGLVLQGGNEMSAQARLYNTVASWQILYQCPALGCNEGAAYKDQTLGEVCHLEADGYSWALVYNYHNKHSGFVNRHNLVRWNSTPHCADVPPAPRLVKNDAILFQCPSENCNRGELKKDQLARVECHVRGHDDWFYIWTYNLINHHEGFFLDKTTYGLPGC